MRKTLFLLGIISLAFGAWSAYESIRFLHSSIKTEAKVLGYSSIHKLDRIESDCSAYSKGCAVKISFTLPNATEATEVLIPTPIFSRAKSENVTILVNPNDTNDVRVASLHVLFRNATTTIFLGFMSLFLGWLIGNKKAPSLH